MKFQPSFGVEPIRILTMTIPLTLVSFFFAMIIAVAVALVQYANVPVQSLITYSLQDLSVHRK